MKDLIKNQNIINVIENFPFKGELVDYKINKRGHINDTFVLTFKEEEKTKDYILQRINSDVFTNPDQLMENIIGVTNHLRGKIIEKGGNPNRETLNVVMTKDQKPYYSDGLGNFWRVYNYVTEVLCFEKVENPEDFSEIGWAFGNFQKLLADYPAHTLHESIKDFHNTKKRFETFVEVLKEDKLSRAKDIKNEVNFVLDREEITGYFNELVEKEDLPLRVTHNDTKLNNILIDQETKKAICVIDLDTIMPGLAVNDFGDAIESGASSGAEDEKDLSKVECDLDLFEAFTKGFIKGTEGKLTEREIDLLPMGAKIMTLECGIRFLTDYLDGDRYFRTTREGQNLDRARTQFKLVLDMENKWDQLVAIVNKYK